MPPAAKKRTMQKFLFKAHAVALRGTVRKPYYQELGSHLEIATFAGSAGQTKCTSRGFALAEDIAYDLATTEIVAEKLDGNMYQSTVTAQVKNLRIGKRLTVDTVTCRLRSVYDGRAFPGRAIARILPAGSSIKNLRIDGKVQDLPMPSAFSLDQKSQDAFFRGEYDKDPAFHPGRIADPIYVKDLGTIFFGEWVWVHPGEQHRQHLGMLRLALGSEFGAEIDVGIGGNDGSGWPPLFDEN
jgi:hypothetical protein